MARRGSGVYIQAGVIMALEFYLHLYGRHRRASCVQLQAASPPTPSRLEALAQPLVIGTGHHGTAA